MLNWFMDGICHPGSEDSGMYTPGDVVGTLGPFSIEYSIPAPPRLDKPPLNALADPI
jgi:hypothetical protein